MSALRSFHDDYTLRISGFKSEQLCLENVVRAEAELISTMQHTVGEESAEDEVSGFLKMRRAVQCT